MIRAAIFDVDGTLLDSSEMWEHTAQRYLQAHGITPKSGTDDAVRNMSLTQGAQYLKTEYTLPYSTQEIVRHITRMTEQCYRSQLQAKTGARELLAALKGRCVHMAIATAGDKGLALAALERLGLAGFFTAAVSCSEYGPKTSAEVYLAAAERIFAIPSEAIVFEDSLVGIAAAKAAGFTTAAVADISEENQELVRLTADFYADSLMEYAGRTEELLGS